VVWFEHRRHDGRFGSMSTQEAGDLLFRHRNAINGGLFYAAILFVPVVLLIIGEAFG